MSSDSSMLRSYCSGSHAPRVSSIDGVRIPSYDGNGKGSADDVRENGDAAGKHGGIPTALPPPPPSSSSSSSMPSLPLPFAHDDEYADAEEDDECDDATRRSAVDVNTAGGIGTGGEEDVFVLVAGDVSSPAVAVAIAVAVAVAVPTVVGVEACGGGLGTETKRVEGAGHEGGSSEAQYRRRASSGSQKSTSPTLRQSICSGTPRSS
eukprot:ANDGO_08242.mRNA.1 hypothetical protein